MNAYKVNKMPKGLLAIVSCSNKEFLFPNLLPIFAQFLLKIMSYKMINNLLGWLTFLVALVVYSLTLEPSVSLWDCGEFISASYKLQVVHPPGAPFFLLIGRLFAMFASDPSVVPIAVNMMSAVSSALTVLFTFWITTHFAKKMVKDTNETASKIAIFGAGLVAALALTFMDSFWFSAVEAEVYAMSSLFTALTFWAALRWEESESQYADKWLVLIAYLIGLAIGTHLLNLLVIPTVVFIYYFKKFTPSRKGMAYSFLAGLVILGFVQKIIIPGVPALMADLDILFVNDFGLPFNSGSITALLLLIGATVYGIYYFSKVKPHQYANLGFVCLAYVLFGYSTYAMVVVRSSDNPAIDMNNPEEPSNLLSYINREQYGDRPLLKGPYFNAQPIDVKEGKTNYRKDSAQYVISGVKQDYVYNDADYTFFPRMGPADKPEQGYYSWGNMSDLSNEIEYTEQQIAQAQTQQEKQQLQEQLQALKSTKPHMSNNLSFLASYQIGHMYFRYFMWNFVGRQNDQQGHDFNQNVDGNWISGIKFLDAMRLGPQTGLPTHMENNQARNKYFFIPLILGILGLVFHFKRQKNDATVTMILFLFTGILINIYLNQPPYEPRERDYSLVGSFQTFCIWIGLGVLFLFEQLKQKLSAIGAAALSLALALTAPYLMASQGWNDHDRSKRYIGIDFAKNCLMSCPPNAVLFTNGDNDTYPLWYAQNVEGFRTDVRIINQSLLPTDWYSQILLTKVYNSEPLPLSLKKTDLDAGVNDYYQYQQGLETGYRDLSEYIRELTASKTNQYYSQTKFKVSVDKQAVLAAGVVTPEDTNKIVSEMTIDFPRRSMTKGDLVLLDLVATNAKTGWRRPICFTTTSGSDGFTNLESYFERKGLVFQVIPVKSPNSRNNVSKLDANTIHNNLMKVFKYSGMKEKKGFFLDDKATTGPYAYQELFVTLAGHYLDKIMSLRQQDSTGKNSVVQSDIKGYQAKIKELLTKCELEIPESVYHMPHQTRYYFAMIWHEAGDDKKAEEFLDQLYQNCLNEVKYYTRFTGSKKTRYLRGLTKDDFDFMERCSASAKDWGLNKKAEEFDKTNKSMTGTVSNFVNMD